MGLTVSFFKKIVGRLKFSLSLLSLRRGVFPSPKLRFGSIFDKGRKSRNFSSGEGFSRENFLFLLGEG
jgi:hypothetical protein